MLSTSSTLTHFELDHCKNVHSFGFLEHCSKLEHLALLLGRQYDHLFFSGKRSYSHTLSQVKASLGQAGDA